MKKFGYLLLFALIMIFYGNAPAFADAAVPFWVYSSHTLFATSFFGERLAYSGIAGIIWLFILGLIILNIVILIEVLVFAFLDRNKKTTLKEKIISVIIANILSTLLGTVLTIPVLLFTDSRGLIFIAFGPSLPIMISLHIICFFLSYYVELSTYKKLFAYKLDVTLIKRVALWTNIWTYFIINIFPLVLFSSLFSALSGCVQRISL